MTSIKRIILALAAAFILPVSAEESPMYSMTYLSMGYDPLDTTTGDFLTMSDQLAFPGQTLEDIKDLDFFGYFRGGSTDSNERGLRLAQNVKQYAPDGTLEKILFSVNTKGSPYAKAVTVLLTNGEGGVHVVVPTDGARYKKGGALSTEFAAFNDNGTVALKESKGGFATTETGTGYAVRGLTATRFFSTDPVLAFKDATVEDIRNSEFTGYTCGKNIITGIATGYNATVTEKTADIATKLRVEMQIQDGKYVKCLVIEFTNGEGGVYVKVLKALYITSTAVGYHFVNGDGTYNGTAQNIARDFTVGNYGIYAIKAYPPPEFPTISWTGAAGDGDPTNTANWEGGELPDENTVVMMGGDVYLNAVEGQTFVCTNIVFTNDVMLTGACDWSAMPVAPTTKEFVLDLDGNGLVLSNVVVNGIVTNAVTDVATLTFNVAEGETIQNTAMSIQGNIQFVKEGAGTFIGAFPNQNYTGGTVVNAGTIKSIGYEMYFYYGADATPFTINAGGTLDINGQYSWYRHHIYLNGGTIANYNGSQTSTSNRSFGDITLMADSTMRFGYHVTFNDTEDTRSVDLGGNTLEIEYADDVGGDGKAIVYGLATTWTNGTVVLGKSIVLRPYAAMVLADDLTLVCDGDLQTTKADKTIGSLTDNSEGNHEDYGYVMIVSGTYKPLSAYLHSVKLLNGSTLDLNKQEDVWSFTCKEGKNQTLTYEDGAKITVDVSEREVQEDEKLIAWEAPPAGVVFVPDETTKENGFGVVIKDDGLYCSKDAIVTAHWTNADEDNDFNNENNWACTNAAGEYVEGKLPGDATTVYFTGDKIPDIEEPVEWLAISVNGSLSTDRNWMGLGETPIVAGSFVDVNGYNWTLGKVFDGTVTNSTEDVENPGSLTLVVDEGTAITNETLALTGNLRLVKQGEGTFVGSVPAQTYTGGTVVNEGVVKASAAENDGANGNRFGANDTDIIVNAGGTFDINGKFKWANHDFVLNGGVLANYGAFMNGYSSSNGYGIHDIRLEDDSFVEVAYGTVFGHSDGVIELNGHTLTVSHVGTEKYSCLYFRSTIQNGTFCFGPKTQMYLIYPNVFGENLTVESYGDFRRGDNALTVQNFLDVSANICATLSSKSILNVTGTFTPDTLYFQNVTLADGATLDLTGTNDTWSVASAISGQAVTFAPGGTVAIDVSGRELAEGDQIIAWEAKPNATFTFAGYEGGLRAFPEADGLYARTTSTEVDKGYWTGAADDGDPMNPQNWACTNAVGEEVTGAIPTNAAASVVIRNLTTDLDWTRLGMVNFAAGEVDLAGHTLTLAAFAETSAAVITNTVEAIGTVKVDIGEGYSSTLGGSTICGNIAFDILSGTFQLTSTTGITGGNPNLVTVGGGATLDENGVIDTPLALLLEDGATLTNTGADLKYSLAQFTGGLTLAEGATAYIDTDHQMALTATGYATMPISIGSGTLVKKGKGKLSVQNGSITGTGKILVEEGEFNIGNAGLSVEDTVTIEVADNAETSTYIWVEVTCSIPNLAGNGRVAAKAASLTVTKCYSGLLQIGQQGGSNPFTNGYLTLGDGVTLDLTEVEGTWTEHAKVVFGENATVKVDLTGRTVEENDKVIAWSAKPPESAKILAKGADVYFVRKDDGLYAAKSFMIFVR